MYRSFCRCCCGRPVNRDHSTTLSRPESRNGNNGWKVESDTWSIATDAFGEMEFAGRTARKSKAKVRLQGVEAWQICDYCGPTGKWQSGQADGQTNGRAGGQTDRRTDRRADRLTSK